MINVVWYLVSFHLAISAVRALIVRWIAGKRVFAWIMFQLSSKYIYLSGFCTPVRWCRTMEIEANVILYMVNAGRSVSWCMFYVILQPYHIYIYNMCLMCKNPLQPDICILFHLFWNCDYSSVILQIVYFICLAKCQCLVLHYSKHTTTTIFL